MLLSMKLVIGLVWYLWALLPLGGCVSDTAGTEELVAVPNIVFTHYGEVQTHHAICVLQAWRSNPTANITVILHKDSNKDAWQDVAAGTGVRIYAPADWKLLEQFQAIYRHTSVNGVTKELYCIYRHLVLHQYMIEQAVPSIIYLDLDIAIFDDLSKSIPPDSTVSELGTFAIHWTQHSLAAFVHYIWHFYERDPLEIARHITEIGIPKPEKQFRLENHASDWWPKSMPRYHLSDMWLFKDFVTTSGALDVLCRGARSLVYNPKCPPALQLMRNLGLHHSVRGNAGAISSAQRVHRLFDWESHPEHGFDVPVMSSNTTKGLVTSTVPGIHFQGKAKLVLAKLLCKDLQGHFEDHIKLQAICQGGQL